MERDLSAPKFTTPRLAAVLGLTRSEFRVLLADGDEENRILPTAGTSTRDVRWSAIDAVRVAVVHRARGLLSLDARLRRTLYRALEPGLIVRAKDRLPTWLCIFDDGGLDDDSWSAPTRNFGDFDLRIGPEPPDDSWLEVHALNLGRFVVDFLRELDRAEYTESREPDEE